MQSENINRGAGGLCSVFPPYPIVVFVLDRATLASSQGLAGISDERHPAAARRGPKSMSTLKHSAGKVLHNQMGFALAEAFFLLPVSAYVTFTPFGPRWAVVPHDLLKSDIL